MSRAPTVYNEAAGVPIAVIYDNPEAVKEVITEFIKYDYNTQAMVLNVELWPLDQWGSSHICSKLTIQEFMFRFFPDKLNNTDEAGSKTD